MDTQETLDFAGYSVRLFRVSLDYGGGWAASAPELAGCCGLAHMSRGDHAVAAEAIAAKASSAGYSEP